MLHYESHILSPKRDWVVFLHGLGGNSNIWYKQVEEFKKHFNLLFIDLRGHGGSKDYKPDLKKITSEELCVNVIDVLDALSIKKAHFAGISIGSVILHGLQTYAPSRIISMVLGGAPIRYTKIAKGLLDVGQVVKKAVPFIWLYKLFAIVLMPKANHKKSRNIFINEAKKLKRKEFIKWYRFAAIVPSIYPKVDTAKNLIPKVYIMGEQDHVFLGAVEKDTIKDKAAEVHIIKGCGHVCNIESHNEFNQVAINFIKKHKKEKKKLIINTSVSRKRTFSKLEANRVAEHV